MVQGTLNAFRPSVCFEVQKIVGICITDDGNRTKYQVQWAPTWISGANLVGCEELIEKFEHEKFNIEDTSSEEDTVLQLSPKQQVHAKTLEIQEMDRKENGMHGALLPVSKFKEDCQGSPFDNFNSRLGGYDGKPQTGGKQQSSINSIIQHITQRVVSKQRSIKIEEIISGGGDGVRNVQHPDFVDSAKVEKLSGLDKTFDPVVLVGNCEDVTTNQSSVSSPVGESKKTQLKPRICLTKKTFTCYICNKVFTRSFTLKNHIKRHKSSNCSLTLSLTADQQLIPRGQSNMGSKSSMKGNESANQNNNNNNNSNNNCNNSNNNSNSTFVNNIQGRKKSSFECNVCKKQFIRSSNLKKHLKKHKSCSSTNLQSKVVASGETVALHSIDANTSATQHQSTNNNTVNNTHSSSSGNKRTFICSICNKVFARQFSLTSHLKLTHHCGGTNTSSIADNNTTKGKETPHKNNQVNQITTGSGNTKKIFTCQICNKQLTRAFSLKNHLLSHKRGTNRTSSLNEKLKLKKHKVTHTVGNKVEDKVVLNVCKDSSPVQGKDSSPVQEHVGNQCPHCMKTYSTVGSLTRHIKHYCIGETNEESTTIPTIG